MSGKQKEKRYKEIKEEEGTKILANVREIYELDTLKTTENQLRDLKRYNKVKKKLSGKIESNTIWLGLRQGVLEWKRVDSEIKEYITKATFLFHFDF